MGLTDLANILDMAGYVLRLHRDDLAYTDFLFFAIEPAHEKTFLPSVGQVGQQLRNMLTIGAKQRQRWAYIALVIGPPLGPLVLRYLPIPSQGILPLGLTDGPFDKFFPNVVAIGDMMHHLPNRPVRA